LKIVFRREAGDESGADHSSSLDNSTDDVSKDAAVESMPAGNRDQESIQSIEKGFVGRAQGEWRGNWGETSCTTD
jgi:hypothetical protein